MAMLQEESNLNEIVQLVGKDSLSAKDQITLEVARMIREDFLQQNSFADNDAYSEYDRQARMLAMIRQYDTQCLSAAERALRHPRAREDRTRQGCARRPVQGRLCEPARRDGRADRRDR